MGSLNRRGRERWRGLSIMAAALLAAAFLWGCSSSEPPKRTFVGAVGKPKAKPEGLNPLGTLETCAEIGDNWEGGARVLISRPEYFSEEASVMIISLRDSLAESKELEKPVEMYLSEASLNTPEQARREGRRCDAIIVLWERRGSHTLEITMPNPSQIPLRSLVHDRLCEFGNHAEQVTILYLTIQGLAAMAQNQLDQADYFLTTANRIDARCLRLPLSGPG